MEFGISEYWKGNKAAL